MRRTPWEHRRDRWACGRKRPSHAQRRPHEGRPPVYGRCVSAALYSNNVGQIWTHGELEGEVADPEGCRRRVPLVAESLRTTLRVGIALCRDHKTAMVRPRHDRTTSKRERKRTSGKVDADLTTIDDHTATVSSVKGSLGRSLILELDVTDTARATGFTVHLDANAGDLAKRLELGREEGLINVPAEVSNPESLGRWTDVSLGRTFMIPVGKQTRRTLEGGLEESSVGVFRGLTWAGLAFFS